MPHLKKSLLMPLVLWAGWFLWAALNAIQWAVLAPADLTFIVRYTTVSGIYGFLACGSLFLFYARVQPRLGVRPFILVAAGLCFVAGAASEYLSGLTLWGLGWRDRFEPTLKFRSSRRAWQKARTAAPSISYGVICRWVAPSAPA